MGRDLVLNLLRFGVSILILALLAILLWQKNEIESRIIDLQSSAKDNGNKLDRLAEAGDDAKSQLKKIADKVANLHAVAASGPGKPGVSAPQPSNEGTGGVDPRTLPYWPTPDNILSDLKNEPVPPKDAPSGGTLQFYLTSNPKSLNVHTNNDAELQEKLASYVYEFLATRSNADPDKWVPQLANRVTANKDYSVFTCYLRKGVFWQKPYLTNEERRGRFKWLDEMPPQEFTADDVKFNFDVIMDDKSECSSEKSYLTDLKSVEVLDRYTVRFTWKRPGYYNLGSTINLVMIYPKFIYSRDADGHVLPPDQIAPTFPQHWFNNKMCGTGPFCFAGFQNNQYIRLVRNDDWWNPAKPKLAGIYYTIVEAPETRLAMFKRGDLDILVATPAQYRSEILQGGSGSVKEMIDQGKVQLKKWEMMAYFFVGWNIRRPQFREKKVRQALACLFPKKRVIRDIFYGLAIPDTGPVHPYSAGFDPNLPRFDYDPQRANKLLDEAGWKEGPDGLRSKVVDGKKVELKFDALLAIQSPTARDMMLLYQKSLQNAGILVTLLPRDWPVMTKMLNDKEFDACVLGWGVDYDGDPSQLWASSEINKPRSSNMCSYASADLDRVIQGLKTTFDVKKRKELWDSFQKILVEDEPYCFTVIPIRPYFFSNRTGNHYLAKLRPQVWLYPWFVGKG